MREAAGHGHLRGRGEIVLERDEISLDRRRALDGIAETEGAGSIERLEFSLSKDKSVRNRPQHRRVDPQAGAAPCPGKWIAERDDAGTSSGFAGAANRAYTPPRLHPITLTLQLVARRISAIWSCTAEAILETPPMLRPSPQGCTL